MYILVLKFSFTSVSVCVQLNVLDRVYLKFI